MGLNHQPMKFSETDEKLLKDSQGIRPNETVLGKEDRCNPDFRALL
jgi:hypothetical protein